MRPSRIGLGLLLASSGCDADWMAPAETATAELGAPSLQVTRGDVQEKLLLTGALDARRSIDLVVPRTDTWNVSIRWMAEDGTEVEAGDRVVEFDNGPVLERLSELELAAIEAAVDLDAAQASNGVEVADKQFEVTTQTIAVKKAKLDAEVPEALLSRREYRDAELELSRAEVALETAKDDLGSVRDGGRLEAKVRRIAFDKSLRALQGAEEQLDSLVLKAPVAGVFTVGEHNWEGRKLQVGDTVWPGMTVGKLPDLSSLTVEASLSDVDEGRIHPGMPVTCTVDAFADRPMPGTIVGVNPVAHEPTRESLRRFFEVVIELHGADPGQLRPGMSVKVEVVTREAKDVLVAPRAALDLPADPVTAIREDGSGAEVVVDFCNATHCVVVSGLEEGDVLGRSEVDA